MTCLFVALIAGGERKLLNKGRTKVEGWKKKWWNPLFWLTEIGRALMETISSFLRLLGFDMPAPGQYRDNVTPEDVDQAYHEAAAAEATQDCRPEFDRRIEGFLRYVESSSEERSLFDLSSFDQELQDFILSLTEDDIEELRRRGRVGQLQAALIGRIPQTTEAKTAPIAAQPSKAELVRARLLAHVGNRRVERAEPGGAVDGPPLSLI